MEVDNLDVMRWQEAEFKRIHGYDWPNCGIADCQYKSCVPSDLCYAHTVQMYGYDPPAHERLETRPRS